MPRGSRCRGVDSAGDSAAELIGLGKPVKIIAIPKGVFARAVSNQPQFQQFLPHLNRRFAGESLGSHQPFHRFAADKGLGIGLELIPPVLHLHPIPERLR